MRAQSAGRRDQISDSVKSRSRDVREQPPAEPVREWDRDKLKQSPPRGRDDRDRRGRDERPAKPRDKRSADRRERERPRHDRRGREKNDKSGECVVLLSMVLMVLKSWSVFHCVVAVDTVNSEIPLVVLHNQLVLVLYMRFLLYDSSQACEIVENVAKLDGSMLSTVGPGLSIDTQL